MPTADTPEQQALMAMLVAEGQEHLFAKWRASDGAEKRAAFFEQIAKLEASYPGARPRGERRPAASSSRRLASRSPLAEGSRRGLAGRESVETSRGDAAGATEMFRGG